MSWFNLEKIFKKQSGRLAHNSITINDKMTQIKAQITALLKAVKSQFMSMLPPTAENKKITYFQQSIKMSKQMFRRIRQVETLHRVAPTEAAV